MLLVHVKEWKRESGEVIGVPFGRRIFYMSVPCSLAVFSSSFNMTFATAYRYLNLKEYSTFLKKTKPLSYSKSSSITAFHIKEISDDPCRLNSA